MKENPHGKRQWVTYLPIRRTKLRAYLITAGVLIGLFGGNQISTVPFAVGVVFMALAMVVHVWAKGHLDKNKTLTRSGPYRWIRDPFHLSNFFLDLGLCLIINNWIFTIILMTFWVIAYNHRLGEEHEMLVEIFGDDYLEYKARIPRMIPYRKPLDKERYGKPFSVRHTPIYRGMVCTRLFRFASYPYLLFAASRIGQYGKGLLQPGEHPLFYWAVAGFLFFNFLSVFAAPITCKRKPPLPLWMLRWPPRLVLAVVVVVGLPVVQHMRMPGTATPVLTAEQTGLLFAALVVVLALIGARGLWQSFRFRRLIEGLLLAFLCLFSPFPWVMILPLTYYQAAFLFGHPGRVETDVDHVFPEDEGMMPLPLYLLVLALFYAAAVPVVMGLCL